MLLDIQTYRDNENIAKNHLPSWRIAQRHNLDIFEKHGFPVRLHSLLHVRQLLDTMQENRFDAYMFEIGGFTDAELHQFLAVCRKIVKLQQINFQNMPIILPLSSLMAYFVIYQKIIGMRPNLANILEIGPGCGYLSFFLESVITLENYSQIEACESFYLLQNIVNSHTFQDGFSQEAIMTTGDNVHFYTQSHFHDDLEKSICIPDTSQKRCYHYPWWQIGKLANSQTRFDLITSNANLLEMNPAALTDYLVLINQKLAQDGLFFMHCTGYPGNGTTESLLDKLFEHGFAPLLLLPGWGVDTEFNDPVSKHTVSKKFTVTNGVFATSNHHSFATYYNKQNYQTRFMADLPELKQTFFQKSIQVKSIYSRDDIKDLLIQSL